MRAEGDEELSGKWTSFRRTSGKQHKVAPKKQPITTVESATKKVVPQPFITRLKTSLPKLSVPIR